MSERTFESQFDAPPLWHRSRLRWVNGVGFAMTLALALWLLLAGVGQLAPAKKSVPLQIPTIYLVVAGAAMLATVVLFAVILFRFLWRGVDFGAYRPRVYLFFWSLAGLLAFGLQGLVLLLFDAKPIPNVPAWAMDFLWFLCPFGVAAFAILAYVNSELPDPDGAHEQAWDDHDAYNEYEDDEQQDDHEELLA